MTDMSHLDEKYFIDDSVYNCPFCNRRNVKYTVPSHGMFDWSNSKECHIWFVKCSSCEKKSMHLSYSDISWSHNYGKFKDEIDIDSNIFYSVPTSFFVIDNRVPRLIRELITEAEGSIKMNFLTGASACTRKAIYELTIKEEAEGDNYEDKIKFLKKKFPQIDETLFDILCHIKDMTSDKVHEQSWDKWDSKHLTLFIETLKAILHEIYVVPEEKKKRSEHITGLLPDVFKDKTFKLSKETQEKITQEDEETKE